MCQNLVNSGINYQPQLVFSGISAINRITSRKKLVVAGFGWVKFLGTAGSAKCCSDLYEHFFSRYFCWYYPARFYSHRGFLKWWYPTTMGFPTKKDHFGVFGGYHYLRKHPHRYRKFGPPLKGEVPKMITFGKFYVKSLGGWVRKDKSFYVPIWSTSFHTIYGQCRKKFETICTRWAAEVALNGVSYGAPLNGGT